MFCFVVFKSFLVKCIPQNFFLIWLLMEFFLISFSDYSLLVYRNAIDFYVQLLFVTPLFLLLGNYNMAIQHLIHLTIHLFLWVTTYFIIQTKILSREKGDTITQGKQVLIWTFQGEPGHMVTLFTEGHVDGFNFFVTPTSLNYFYLSSMVIYKHVLYPELVCQFLEDKNNFPLPLCIIASSTVPSR